VFSGGIFHRNVVLERLQEFWFLDALYLVRIPPDSSGFLRIPAGFLFTPNLWYD
jgi:hypothetical protein